MSSTPFDGRLRLVEMLRSLDAAGARFVVFGAVAAGLHGHVRGTTDLDVILDPAADNLDRATRWLIGQDARLARDETVRNIEVSSRLFRRGQGVTAITAMGEIDMVVHLPGLPPWPTLLAAALTVPFEGMQLRVVDRETLIASKRQRGTPLDLDDIEKLEALDS